MNLTKKCASGHAPQLLATPVDKFAFVPKLSFGTSGTGNAILQADNLAALKVFAEFAVGKVRCVYIDPPYNNQEKYTHYNDAIDHNAWLASITARLEYF